MSAHHRGRFVTPFAGGLCDDAPVKHVFAVISLTVLAACSAPTSDTPAPPAQQQPAQQQPAQQQPAPAPALQLSQQCTNERAGFTISYPAGWHTNSGDVIPACSAFDPEPVEIPAQSEVPFEIAVVIGAQDVAFDKTATESQFERILSSERLTIAGRPAMRAEVEATGEGLADRGMRTLRYAIDLGSGRSLVASTNRTGDSYEQEKEILGKMVETISLR